MVGGGGFEPHGSLTDPDNKGAGSPERYKIGGQG